MNARNRGLVFALALCAIAPLGCKDKPAETVDAAPPAASSAAVAPMASTPAADSGAAAEGPDGGRGRRGDHAMRGRGPAAMFLRVARELPDLKDDQKAKLDDVEKSLRAGVDPASRDAMKAAGKELHTELIAGIKAGKIDNAKLEPRYAAIEKVVKAMHEKEAEALTALHAALTPSQRKALVTDLRTKQKATDERLAKRAERAKERGDAGARPGHGAKRIERLTSDLELDAEQQKKVAALAPKDEPLGGPDRAEMKKRMEAIFVAFEKDTFDAKKNDAFDAKRARGPMEEDTKLVAQLVPILKPEQREKLAAKMERGPGHGRRGGGGAGFDHSLTEVDDDHDDDD